MSKSLNPRVEADVKELVRDIAGTDGTISATARDLIRIGIAVRSEDIEPEIHGPLGLPRPFASVKLGPRNDNLRTEIGDAEFERLVEVFGNKQNTAAREALRLGVLAVASDQFTVEGPGGSRPFAEIEVGEIEDPAVRELIAELERKLE